MTPLDHILALRRARDELEALTLRVSFQVESLYDLHVSRSAPAPRVPDDLALEIPAVTLPDGRVIEFSPAGFMELYALACNTLDPSRHAPDHS